MFADIILPLALPQLFTFEVPADMEGKIAVGHRVTAPLGKNDKLYTGVVYKLHDKQPKSGNAKKITRLADDMPIVSPLQLRLWEWMASYYMCSLGEVMTAALPREVKTDTFVRRTAIFVSLNRNIDSEEKLSSVLDSLKRAKVQYEIMMRYIELCSDLDYISPKEVIRSELSDNYAAIKALKIKGILIETEHETDSVYEDAQSMDLPDMTEYSDGLYDKLTSQLDTTHRVLIHESGDNATKTALIAKTASEILTTKGQTLYLTADTLSAEHIAAKLEAIFPGRIMLYTSRQTPKIRSAAYFRMCDYPGSIEIVVGTRAALFLPFDRLKMIVVDDEHEATYKQSDPAPRYNGRDTALVMARIHGADTILCSRYPSTESLYNAQNKIYGYLKIDERKEDKGASIVRIRRGKELFSNHLIKSLTERTAAGEQSIVFHNRRGFSSAVECQACFHTPRCRYCNVNMVYHKRTERLVCHYCGFNTELPTQCPSCGSADIKTIGWGTQQTEEELARQLPSARIARVDSDNTASNRAAIASFAAGNTDILIGTAMVTHDIKAPNLTLAAIINADAMIGDTDFRAFERSFRVIRQLASIVGDGHKRRYNQVIVQTNDTNHPVLSAAEYDDYMSIYRTSIVEREQFGYPPVVRFVRFTLKHPVKAALDTAAADFGKALRTLAAGALLGPETPIVDRIQGKYIVNFIQKLPRRAPSSEDTKIRLVEIVSRIRKQHKGLYITADVDPV